LPYPHLATNGSALWLLREGEGIAAGVLGSLGVKLDAARIATYRILKEDTSAQMHAEELATRNDVWMASEVVISEIKDSLQQLSAAQLATPALMPGTPLAEAKPALPQEGDTSAEYRSGDLSPTELPVRNQLTPRQQQVLDCAAAGLTVQDTATELSIERDAVNGHRRAIFSNLRVKNISEAVGVGFRLGLLPNKHYDELVSGSSGD